MYRVRLEIPRSSRAAWLVVTLVLVSMVACSVAFGQDTTAAEPKDFPSLLTAYAMPIAAFLGSGIVWLASHAWPAFHNLSVGPDGKATVLGTWAKRIALFLACWLVTLVLHIFGAAVPAALSQATGQSLGLLAEALGSATAAGAVYKLATSAPAKTP